MSKPLRLSCVQAVVLAACGLANIAYAAEPAYPSRPIRFIVAQPPGGGTDVVARMLQPKMSEQLKQQVVVDNHGGAGGIVGTQLAAKAPADGYTILLGYTGNMTINPGLYKKLPYDPEKDFDPVSLAVASPYVLFINPAIPVNSVKELIAYAKANPGKLNFGSAGIGSLAHLTLEWFKSETNTDIVHIPLKGGESLPSILKNETQLTLGSVVAWLPQVKSGKLRAIAITSKTRSKALPDVPTVIESGIPNFEAINWFGVVAPHGTPRPAIDRLYSSVATSIKSPEMTAKLMNEGTDPVGSTPEEFAALIKTEIKRWAQMVKQSGATAEQ